MRYRRRFLPLEGIRNSCGNYAVEVTKGMVKGRGMFAVNARSRRRVARSDLKGKKTERGRGRGKEEGGAPRNAAQLLIRLRAQSASSRARGRRGPPTSARDLWIIFSPFLFSLPPFLPPPEQTRGDTSTRRTQESTNL